MTVVIVLPYMTEYRVMLFTRMREFLAPSGVVLHVFAGTPEGKDRARRDESLGLVSRLPQKTFIGGRLRWRDIRLPAQGADLVIMEQAVKNLDTWFELLFHRQRAALWGHGQTITEARSWWVGALQDWMTRRAKWVFARTRQ